MGASAILSVASGVAIAVAGAFPFALSPLNVHAATADVGGAGVFELDGNVAQDAGTPPPYDWSCVFNAPAHAGCPPPASVMLGSVFQADYANPDPTYFASNKDIENVTAWGCVTLNNPLNKDDILNAYGAAFVPTTGTKAGHLLLYLAQERDSNNGNSFAGFWLMHNQHACTGSGGFSNGGHDKGDLLVVSNYTNGGTSATVELWSWDPTNPAAVNNLVALGSGFTCGVSGALSSNDICGIANTSSFTEPWAPNQSLGANQFVEVGIDATNLIPPPTTASGACFNDFLAETRSSQELTATLKDFTTGHFQFCVAPRVTTQQSAAGATTAASMTVEKGTSVSDQATLGAPLSGTPGGTITYKLFSTSDCTGTPVFTSGPLSLSGGVVPPSAAAPTSGLTVGTTYQWQAFYSGDVGSGGHNSPSQSTCGDEPLNLLDANITITPQTATNGVGVQHVFTITASVLPAATSLTSAAITTSVTPAPSSSTTTCASPVISGNQATCTLTINSTSVATYTANAAATLVASGVTMHRSTNSAVIGSGPRGPGGSGPATKYYVDASIAIAASAVNEVGHQHVFTITVTAIPGAAPSTPAFSAITPSVSPAPSSQSTTCATPTVNGNVATCTLTINSSTAGVFTANATATVTIGGAVLQRSTDSTSGFPAGPNGSGPATKTYVDASVSIGPSAVNPVNNEHVFTIVVTAIPAGATPVSFGTITTSVVPTPGTMSTTCATPVISGDTATCTLTIDSALANDFAANATAQVTMGGVTVTRSTSGNSGPGGSGPATKTFVDASVAISPSAVNEVGHQHVFTVTVTAIPAGATPVVFTSITPSVSPAPTSTSNTCAAPVVNGDVATCTVTVNNSTAGTFTVNAAAVVTMGGTAVNRSTNGSAGPTGPGGTGPSTKTFVDASVAIGPATATNVVGAPHTFTVTVTAIPSGATPVSFGTITPSVTPQPSSMSTTCASPTINGDVATCTVTINSTTATTYTANVTASVTMGGVTVTRSTSGNHGPGGSGPATKIYEIATITIAPTAVNEVGHQHVFTVTVTSLPGQTTVFNSITPSVTPTPNLTDSSTCGSPTINGNVATCTITVNSSTAGVFTAGATAVLTINGFQTSITTDGQNGDSGTATKTYVDASIAITPATAVNEVGHQHVFTVTVTSYPAVPVSFSSITTSVTPTPGTISSTCGSPVVSGTTATCTITIDSSSAGTFTANAAAVLTVDGVVLHRSTDGSAGVSGPGGSGPAVKHYVDASVSIGPSAVNEVGNQHVFDIVVTAYPGGTTPVLFTSIAPSVSPTPGTETTTCDNPTVNGNTATCTLTVDNSLAATFQANVTAQVSMGGVVVTRSTSGNAGPNGSGPATKTYVDASIAIGPSAVNPVNNQHVFTITVTAIPSTATPVVFNSITPTVSPAPSSQSTTCGSPVINGDVATCTLTINSTTAGTFTANAAAVVTMGGTSVNRSTDGIAGPMGPGGSGPATKTFVDAAVAIGPTTATNVVGAPHTFTVTVTALPGGASPVSFGAITPSVVPSPTTLTSTCGTPTLGPGNTATCTVTITSNVAAVYTANVTADVTMGGVTVTRSTSGNHGPGGSGPATKIYGLATITIAPTAVNEVGHEHVFTVTVTSIPGQTTSFDSITPSVVPTPDLEDTSTCGSPVINANVATCTVTINSSTAGVFTASASAKVTINGFQTTISTDGQNGDSGPAVKTYVDASIAITPATAVNEVGNQHVFTVTVTGFPTTNSGLQVTSITTSVVPTPGTMSTTCGSPVVSGMQATCTITIDSSSAGTFTANAAAVVSVDGLGLQRSTDGSAGGSGPGGSGPAVKHYVDASIAVTPATAVNEVGNQHVFTVTVTAAPGGASPVSFGAITTSVAPTPDDQSTTCDNPVVNGDVATCTITIDNATAGTFTANASATVTIGGVVLSRSTTGNSGPLGSGPAVKHYVDASVAITPATAVNEVGAQHVFTITVTAIPGGASPVDFTSIAATVTPTPDSSASTCASPVVVGDTATCTLTIDSSSAGTFTANAAAVVTIGGVVLDRSTDGSAGVAGPGGSGPAVKNYVDASIGIGPSAVNPIGKQHVFDIVVTAYPAGATPVTFGTITPTVSPTALTMSTTCDTPTINGDQATCTLTIDNDLPATFTAGVSATVTMGGVTVSRSTSGNHGPGGTGPATKTYVTANIGLSPLVADDPVGDHHVLTATVTIDDGSGAGAVPAPDGTVVNFSIAGGPGTLAQPSCTTSGGTGTCTDVLTSNVAGKTVIHAATTVVVKGVTLDRATNDSVPGDSVDAVKTWHKVQPSITTAQSAGGTVGISVSDTATVSGGLNPGGTVSFQLFSPTDTTCTGTPVFSSANRPLSGGKAASGSFAPTAAGTYHWVATYNGDDANLTAVSGCNDEPVTLVTGAVQGIVTPPTTGARVAWGLGLGLILAGLVLRGISWRRRRDGAAGI